MGALPLPIEHGPSSYGEEADIQRNIAAAAQYNPATKLGITAGDRPSKKATSGGPTPAQAVGASPVAQPTMPVSAPLGPKRAGGYGPSAGLGPKETRGPVWSSSNLEEHFAHLRGLPDLSPEMQQYV